MQSSRHSLESVDPRDGLEGTIEGEEGQKLQRRSAADSMHTVHHQSSVHRGSEIGAPVGIMHLGPSKVSLETIGDDDDKLPEASRLQALALFQELSHGLFQVRDLLAQYKAEGAARHGGEEPPDVADASNDSLGPPPGGLASQSSEIGFSVNPMVGPTPTPMAPLAETSERRTSLEEASEQRKRGDSSETRNQDAIDRARRASAKPGTATLEAQLRNAEIALDEARATAAAERAGRLALEAKLRELGVEVPEFRPAPTSSGSLDEGSSGSGGGGSTPTLEKQRSAGEMIGSAVNDAMANASALFGGILPKPNSPDKSSPARPE